jgi:tRNA threonylcarbamoyladenosine biosynthesis protein TsaE
MTEFVCKSLQDTKRTAIYFSQFAKPGQCFALFGNLGYGKTTFSRYLIQSLNSSIKNIPSPTFTIIQIYDSEISEIWHVDCYRLKSIEEFCELGLEEAFNSRITIIEWPEIISDFLPANTIKIDFSMGNALRRTIRTRT